MLWRLFVGTVLVSTSSLATTAAWLCYKSVENLYVRDIAIIELSRRNADLEWELRKQETRMQLLTSDIHRLQVALRLPFPCGRPVILEAGTGR